MGVLDDMLDDTGGQPRPASTFGDVVARAVGGRNAKPGQVEAPSLDPLLTLDDGTLRRLIRYLPAEAMVPLLAKASVPVASRLVGLLDDDSQTWLAAQSEAIESCAAEAHAAAAHQALGLISKAQGAGPLPAPSAPRAAPRPVEVGVAFTGSTVAAAPPAATTTPVMHGDDVIETLCALVAVAAGRDARQLVELAEAADHPVLSAGLRRVAAGASGHELDEAMRQAGQGWIADQERRIELMRLAMLAIRFSDSPQHFRERAQRV